MKDALAKAYNSGSVSHAVRTADLVTILGVKKAKKHIGDVLDPEEDKLIGGIDDDMVAELEEEFASDNKDGNYA